MSPKELEPNKDKIIPTNEPAVTSVPATGLPVDAVAETATPAVPTAPDAKSPIPQGKVTPDGGCATRRGVGGEETATAGAAAARADSLENASNRNSIRRSSTSGA